MNRIIHRIITFSTAVCMLLTISGASAVTKEQDTSLSSPTVSIMGDKQKKTHIMEDKKKKTQLTVTGVDVISDITVNYGTTLSDVKLKLPSEVKVTLNNGSQRYVALDWNNGTPSYNGNISRTYTFTSPLMLEGVKVPNTLKTVKVKVIVSNIVTTVSEVSPISVTYGASLEYVMSRLPQSVNITLIDGSSKSTPVVWEVGNWIYDGDEIGANYDFIGTLQLPSDIQNPLNLKAEAVVMITNGNDNPNPNTTLNTSAGTSLFEFDSTEDWKASVTASAELDINNYVSGNASVKTGAVAPITIAGQNTSYYTLETAQTVNDRLKEMKNMEFNLFIPDKTQIDYMVINFYTDSSHNYFFQNAIGVWELSPGWNKIRRPLSDFNFINSISLVNSTSTGTSNSLSSYSVNTVLEKEAKSLNGTVDVMSKKSKLKLKVNQLNLMLGKKNKALKTENSNSITSLDVPSTWDSIDNIEIFVASKTNSVPKVNFDKIAYNVSGVSKLLFTFDDAWYDVKKYAEPILSTKGFKGTTWANMTDSIASNEISVRGPLDVMNESDLAELYAKGWDIGNHTANHVDNVTLLNEDQMRNEYLTNQNWLLSNGWERGAYHVCYPSGSYNDKLIEILKGISVKSGRCTEYGIQPTPVYNIYKIKTVFISRDTNVADIKAQIDKAVETGSSLFFMLHRVEENPIYTDESEYNALAVSTEKFSQIVEYVSNLEQQGMIEVETISEWYKGYMD